MENKHICNSYQNLSYPEKIKFAGELLHAAMFSEKYFEEACELINKAIREGVLDKVKIFPEIENEGNY